MQDRGRSGRDDGPVPRSPRGEGGFTLIEVMVVIVILGLLTTVVATQVRYHLIVARQTAARLQIEQLERAVQEFKLYGGRYPESLEDLVRRPADYRGRWPAGTFLEKGVLPRDPWGNEYAYGRLPPGGNWPFRIVSYGADGREGGEDEDADLSNLDATESR